MNPLFAVSFHGVLFYVEGRSSLQMCNFSPAGVTSCDFKCPGHKNLLSQVMHLNDFSPVWAVLSCLLKTLDFKNPLPHSEQVNVFLLVIFTGVIYSTECF